MTFAYADPPYLGCAKKHYSRLHPQAGIYDTLQGHVDLITELKRDFDCWALSMASTNLHQLLPHCPNTCRVMAWVKPFAIFKPGVGLAYTWEPVIINSPRPRIRTQPTLRDHLSESITLKKGLVGAKPPRFAWWLFDAMNIQEGDSFIDLFPGTGVITEEYKKWIAYRRAGYTAV